MKVLIAADIFPPESGGPATYVVKLANALPKEDVVIVSLNPNSERNAVSCSLFFVSSHKKLFRYFQYFWLLFKKSKHVDVIYAMGPVNAGLPAYIVSVLRRKKFFVKVVGDYAWEQGVQRFGVKSQMDEFQKKSFGVKVEIFRAIQKFVTRHATRVIVPSLYLKKIVKGWGVPEKFIETIYNAVPFLEVKPKQKPEGEKWIVTVARLVPWKGVDVLIDVVEKMSKKMPEVKLKIVGDGPEFDTLQNKIKALQLENTVEMLGNLSHEKTLSIIGAADVFVLNSGYEGMSHVLLEATHAGVPTLASLSGGNTEILVGWERGDLFEYNNAAQIEEKILKVLEGNFVVGPWKENEKEEFLDMYSEIIMVERVKRVLFSPRVLMVSLDPHFVDVDSKVASRVLSTLGSGEIFVIIPGKEDSYVRPHRRLHIYQRGGSKIRQFFSLWWLGKKLNRHEKFHFITSQDPFFTGLLGILIGKRKQEVVVQMHGDFYSTDYYKKSGVQNFVRYYLGLCVISLATQIRVVSERIYKSLRSRGVKENKIYIQPVKVDTEGIQKAEPNFDIHRKYLGSKKVFLFLGRFEKVKNLFWLLDVFAEALKKESGMVLVMVGDGSEKKQLQYKVSELGLERSIVFEPWTSDPISYLKTCDGLLFPSLSEGYGMIVIEALAAGCPVIMNDVGVAGYEVKESDVIKIISVEKRGEWIEAILNTESRMQS